MIISLPTLTARLAEKLRALSGASEWGILDLNPEELRSLSQKLVVRGTKSPLGQKLTLHGWSSEGKIIRMLLNKFIRTPQRGRMVAIEERTWHGLVGEPPAGDLVAALEALCARGKGAVQLHEESGRTRCVCHDLSMVLSRIAVEVDNGTEAGPDDASLASVHQWSRLEVWWWRYFKTAEVRSRVVSMRDIDLIICSA